MIQTITGHSLDEIYSEAIWRLRVSSLNDSWLQEDTRNGKVLVCPTPVVTTYLNPRHRVLFNPVRDANPFFHLMEALWMLAGRRDVDFVARYAKQMRKYSDDGVFLRGAYGYRWRNHFGFDQIQRTINDIKRDPNSRRLVISMYDPTYDSYGTGLKDIPCNTHLYFRVYAGTLDMTICNRSNDVIWGAYGANPVHMSILQEYIASHCDLAVGTMYQFSNNWHIYEQHFPLLDSPRYDPSPYPLVANLVSTPKSVWDDDLTQLMSFTTPAHTRFEDPFFRRVAGPMKWAHYLHTEGRTQDAIEHLLDHMCHCDWRIAGVEWLDRRLKRKS